MQRQKTNKDLQIAGVVYKYTSPSGKSYIGQTTNEAHRRRTWFCTKRRYAGSAINRARKKYGPENFDYEVLFKKIYSNFDDARAELDRMEIYYIGKYDTLKNGYNNTVGGLCPETVFQTQMHGRIVSKQGRTLSAAQMRKYLPKHTKEEIQQMRKETNRKNGRWKKIYQFDLDGNFIREFASAGEAQELGFGLALNIKRACKTLGKYKGYNWRFAEDGYVMKVKPPKQKKPKKVYVLKGYATKRVVKCSKNGAIIKEYDSIKDAMADNGIKYCSSISSCLSGRRPTAGGYVWKYKKEA